MFLCPHTIKGFKAESFGEATATEAPEASTHI